MTVTNTLSGPPMDAPKRGKVPAWLRYGLAAVIALAIMGGSYALVLAQVSGERGITPTASSTDVQVRGIEVDVRGDNAEDARQKGWRQAQREAWRRVKGPPISESQLQGLVSSIVIQRERVAPRRYIATLGVIFDRQRSARYLGGEVRTGRSSAPMLVIPVTVSGGTYTSFEVRNPWQRAWAEFNPGASRVDYVRPTGAGGDSLLLNYGQTGRRSRAWWRTTLDQYGAADVLAPIARLDHQFPGGPIRGTFTARYGPDSRVLESFELTANEPSELQEMLEQAVERLDAVYEAALAAGKLQPDPTLRLGGSGEIDPALMRLIEIGQAIQARDAAAAAGVIDAPVSVDQPTVEGPTPPAVVVRSFVVQFASPDAGAFDAALTGVRGAPGVRGVAVTSTAMGGTSVMTVSYGGTLEELAAALRARGFAVNQGANALAISR